MIENFNQIIGALTIFAQIASISGLVYLFLPSIKHNIRLDNFIRNWGVPLTFIIALTATLGSLFYSEIAGYPPCELCWYQRIFMYPQVLLLGLASWRKENNIIRYSLILTVIGFIIATYHSYIAYAGSSSAACSAVAFTGISCLRRYVLTFNYITIPIMAASAFALMIVILLNVNKIRKRN